MAGKGKIVGPGRRGGVTNFNETHPGETQDQSRARKGYQDRRGGEEQGKSVTRNGGRLRAIQLFEMSDARKSRSS